MLQILIVGVVARHLDILEGLEAIFVDGALTRKWHRLDHTAQFASVTELFQAHKDVIEGLIVVYLVEKEFETLRKGSSAPLKLLFGAGHFSKTHLALLDKVSDVRQCYSILVSYHHLASVCHLQAQEGQLFHSGHFKLKNLAQVPRHGCQGQT